MSKKSALKLFIFLLVVALCGLLMVGCGGGGTQEQAQEPAQPAAGEQSGPAALFPKKVTPRLASAEIEGDPMSVWGKTLQNTCANGPVANMTCKYILMVPSAVPVTL